MGDSRLLGCWGLLVALVLMLVLGWLTLELLLGTLGAFDAEGVGALTDVQIWRELGQLLVVSAAVVGLYSAVFRPATLASLVPLVTVPAWLGAALSLGAWARLPAGARGGLWSLVLAAVGLLTPLLLSRLSSRER